MFPHRLKAWEGIFTLLSSRRSSICNTVRSRNTPISHMELVKMALSILSTISTFLMAKSFDRLLNDKREVMYEVLKYSQLQSAFEQVS
jgi:hypothetical protein